MICSFGAILAWKSDDDADTAAADDYDDYRKSDPYMSPSYAGDTIKYYYIKWKFTLIDHLNSNNKT